MSKAKEKEIPKKQKQGVVRGNLKIAAYYRWLERGCPMGDDLTDWIEVERKYVTSAKHN